jgi:hypothetical protein
MTSPTADNPDSEGRNLAKPRPPDQENVVRGIVRELVDSLEKSMARPWRRRLFLIPILAIVIMVLSFACSLALGDDAAPLFAGIALAVFALALVIPFAAEAIAELINELALHRTTRQFTQRFPEGASERPLAIGMLSEIKTPHKAGHKLLQALSPPQEPTLARSSSEPLGCAASGTVFVLGVLVTFRWESYAKSLEIDDKTRELVAGAIFGVFAAVWAVGLFGIKSPGLKAGLVYYLAVAIGIVLFRILQKRDEKSLSGGTTWRFLLACF